MNDSRRSQGLYFEVPLEPSKGSALKGGEVHPKEEETQVLLAPFSPIPSLDFGEIRLGKSCKRILRCVNPSGKILVVSVDKFPKEEKGFSLDFRGPFKVHPQQEALLAVGWVPASGGGMRETLTIKYGSFKTSITMSGFCLDPQAEKLRKMSFRRPVLKSIQQPPSAGRLKVPLPPNPVLAFPLGISPPKRALTGAFKVPKTPAQSMKGRQESQMDIVSWSPQPVHFMDGSFLRKGEESKLMEAEKVRLPSWTGSTCRKLENNWTAVDENFIRQRQQGHVLVVADNESFLPTEESLIADGTQPFPLRRDPSAIRREGFVPASNKVNVFSPVSTSCPKDSKPILNEIESVKAKLEESGIKSSFDATTSASKVLQKSSDILNDIQTNLVCSPMRSSDIIEKLQLSGINVCLDLSPDKEQPPPMKTEKPASCVDLSFNLDLSLSPKEKVESNNIDLSINVDLDLSPKKTFSEDSPPKESPESFSSEEQAIPETHFSKVCNTSSNSIKSEEVIKKDNEIDEISLMVAEHLSVDKKVEEEDASPVKSSYVFSVPTVHSSKLPVSTHKMDEISLLVAQHLNEDELRKKVLSDHLVLNNFEEIKKYDYKEDTIYETNLHECKESFLQTTINETSFVPIPEKGYCSTAVKDKTRELSSIQQLSAERSSAFCRDLFGSKTNNSNTSIANETHLEAVKAPVKAESSSPAQNNVISSDTYILSPEAKNLSTIREVSEHQRTKSCSKFSKKLSSSKISESNESESSTCSKTTSKAFTVPLSPPSKETKLSSSKTPAHDESGKKSFRSVREKQMTIKPRSTHSTSSVSSASSASKTASPLKKGSPFKRRSLVPKPMKPSSKSGLTLIKMAAASNPKLQAKSSIARHPNLFSAKNLYYDERWIDKQKRGFAKWLNFILTPSEESQSKKTDGAKLWSACAKDVKNPRAPTREVLSFKAYTMEKEMNTLRLAAIRLWQSPQVVKVITQLEIEIEKKRLFVRDDRCLNKDLGIKQSFLSILLNYNSLWLRIGLETIYGEVLQLSGNSDIVGISRFIITRLLSDPNILEIYSHPTVPHLYKPGHEEALKKFTLKMFMRLIFFLDVAKNQKLIKHDPCLFCKDADFKMSRDLLVEFSKKFLACEGDITKHLRSIGYDVTHKQSILDEFDYAIGTLPADLKCGIRLCRVMELLLGGEYTSKVRIPAHSRLQKIHNVTIALEALKSSPAGLPKDIDAKDIVNGHVEKCLGLIWHIIHGFGLVSTLPECKWMREIEGLRTSLKTIATIHESATAGLSFVEERESDSHNEETDSTAKFVLTWARLVCAHYGIEIENLTVSFSDGRALCFLIHHYYPSLLTQEEIMMNTTVSSIASSDVTTSVEDNKKMNEELLNNEKRNFKTFLDKVNELGGVPMLIRSSDMSNTIPDQKVTMAFLIYLASRLLHLREEVSAAIKIQSMWRRLKKSREKKYFENKYSTTDL